MLERESATSECKGLSTYDPKPKAQSQLEHNGREERNYGRPGTILTRTKIAMHFGFLRPCLAKGESYLLINKLPFAGR